MDTRVVTAHLPADLAKKLDRLAERLDQQIRSEIADMDVYILRILHTKEDR